MKKFTQILYIAFFTLTCALSQKNGDESNPYEFGFTIDGQQHRHEKKDVKGIIEGEFGFITADGIYHVTVYATDENGKFKILSMRNLRISAPLDGSPLRGELSPDADKYRKQAGLAPLPQAPGPAKTVPNPLVVPQSTPEQPTVAITPRNEAPFKFTTQPTIKPACASCGYVTTQKPIPGQSGNGFQFQNPIFQKQDQEKHIEQQPFDQSGPGPEGPLSVPIPIPPSEPSAGIEVRFDGAQGNQFQDPQNTQNVGGHQQQSSQYPGNNLPQYQIAQGPQNTNYNTIGGANKFPSEVNQGAQYPSSEAGSPQYVDEGFGGAPGVQPSSGGSQNAQYPSSSQYSGGGGQSPQYPSGEAGGQYSSGGQGQGNQNSGYLENGGLNNVASVTDNNGFGGNGPVGGGGLGGNIGGGGSGGYIGGGGSSYQQAPNPLQTPSKEVSNFPPVAVSDGVIHVGGNNKQDIKIKDKFPGMQDGLPEGIEEKDIGDLLYKFHYTVGFHGHYEKGLKNGAKVGGYFVNGRDGISRVVTYVADENGYRPKVKFINLGLSSDETPKPETEKTFGLKSFEFVWYPVE